MPYWKNNDLTTRQLLDKLVAYGVIRTVRYIPAGVDFLYAGRVVSLSLGEAKWFALAHLYHLEKEDGL